MIDMWRGTMYLWLIDCEKLSGQYLGLILMSHWLASRLNSNPGYFGCFTLICLCGESCLLVSWWVGDRCDITGSDEDLDRSRRPGAEDRRWLSTYRVLGGRMIGRSDDAVCGLYRAQGDEERVFLSWALKPRSAGFLVWTSKPATAVWWFGPQNHREGFLFYASKLTGVWFIGCAIKPTGEWRWRGTHVEI
jgi:hypothetical protein